MSRKVSLDQIGYVLDQDHCYLSEESSDNDLQLEQLKKALSQVIRSRLTARQRETLYLYYYEKKKIIEIAALQKVNKSTVSRTLARARQHQTLPGILQPAIKVAAVNQPPLVPGDRALSKHG